MSKARTRAVQYTLLFLLGLTVRIIGFGDPLVKDRMEREVPIIQEHGVIEGYRLSRNDTPPTRYVALHLFSKTLPMDARYAWFACEHAANIEALLEHLL